MSLSIIQDKPAIEPVEVVRNIVRLFKLEESVASSIAGNGRSITCEKCDLFVRVGDKPDYLYLFWQGVVREFVIGEDGKEYTINIAQAPCLVGPLGDKFNGTACSTNYDCILAGSAVKIAFATYFDLASRFNALDRLYAQWLGAALKCYRQRVLSLLSESANQRMRDFEDRFTDCKNDIFSYHIASFLGINPVTLSKIRAQDNYASKSIPAQKMNKL